MATAAPKPAPHHCHKPRLDQLLVARGLAESGTRARALIMAGLVFSGEHRLDKPGHRVASETALEIRGRDHPWVSRGGIKLDHALTHFGIEVRDRVALDVGSSTGGFTDVLLTRGAKRVFAVDVGHGQLAWKLRNDPRVVVREQTNARYLSAKQIPEPVDLITCDASFIGLRTVLPAALALAATGAHLVALIKPQFEVGPEAVDRGGVVRETAEQERVCEEIREWLARHALWSVLGMVESPITGPKGNREFLIAATRSP